MDNPEESYILREYFKDFLPENIDAIPIERINQISRNKILSSVIDQDRNIYSLIKHHYTMNNDIIMKLSEKISSLNKTSTQPNQDHHNNEVFQFRYRDQPQTNQDEDEEEPIAITKINESIEINDELLNNLTSLLEEKMKEYEEMKSTEDEESNKEMMIKLEELIMTTNTKINDLMIKNVLFQQSKEDIIEKYNHKKLLKETSSSSITISNPNTINNQSNFNHLKSQITQLDTTYVSLLKDLSKHIIKPKNIIHMPNKDFVEKKIK